MTKRTCGNCRWWRDGKTGMGNCCRRAPFETTWKTSFCGEWSDASITPEQEERRELTRLFALALAAASWTDPNRVWELAEKLAAAEPQIQRGGMQVSDEQQTQTNPDDPSGPGWRDVEVGEILQSDDMLTDGVQWVRTDAAGTICTWPDVYRRRIEPQQPTLGSLLSAVLWLIDAIQGVQDWKGTNVGEAIDAVETQLVHRKTEVQQ